MLAEVQSRRFTVEEFYRMAEAGVFGPEERLELIEGEIFEMSPIGDRHMLCVDHAAELFFEAFKGRAKVRTQGSFRLNIHNVPQPDVVLFKPNAEYPTTTRANRENCFLFIEVSDSSLRFDTNVKVPIYAKTGIPEVWVEDLKDDLLIVYRDPSSEGYKTKLSLTPDDSVSLSAFPETSFPVRELLLNGLPIVD